MELTVLGVDPGIRHTGYGIVRGTGQRCAVIAAGTVHAPADSPLPLALHDLHRFLHELIERHRPDEAAVEEAFVHRNPKAALQTGSVRGVALLAAVQAGIPVGEYNPQEVKTAIVGRGGAAKGQVAYMVRAVLGAGNVPEDLDGHACDALAVALCHLWRRERRLVDLMARARG